MPSSCLSEGRRNRFSDILAKMETPSEESTSEGEASSEGARLQKASFSSFLTHFDPF